MKPLLLPAAVAALVHAAVLAAFLAAYHGDPSALVCLGRANYGRPPFEAVTVAFPGDGYDGQFYYALARDPWRRHARGLDLAPNRHKRILYPALAWLLTGGEPHALLWALPLVNLLAVAGLAALGGFYCLRQGLSPWWGVLLPPAVNAGLPVLRDLTDPLSTFLVCGLLVGRLTRAPWWALALWAAAALLCREQNLAAVAVVLVVAARQGEARIALGQAAAVAAWAGWVGVVGAAYGAWPFPGGEGLLTGPFLGIAEGLRRSHETASWRWQALTLLGLALLGGNLGGGWVLLRRGIDPVLGGVLLGGGAFVLTGGAALHVDFWGNQRVFALLPLGVWLACVEVRAWRALVPLAAPAAVWLGVVAQAWVRGG